MNGWELFEKYWSLLWEAIYKVLDKIDFDYIYPVYGDEADVD